MLTKTLATAALLALSSSSKTALAQSTGELEVVDAQWTNSGLDEAVPAGFGLVLSSRALMSAAYGDVTIENGQAYSADQVGELPTITVMPGDEYSAWFNESSAYTLMLADASSLGDPDQEGNYRHYLANSMTGSGDSFTPSGGQTITYYAGPGPIEGTGPHRYAWMLFEQPSSFSAPSDLSTEGTSPDHWSVSDYVSQTGLELVAATFFTVENGDPTGSVAETSPVDTSAIMASASSTMESSSSSSAMSETTAMSSEAPSSATSSGAEPTQTDQGGAAGTSTTSKLVAGAAAILGLAMSL